MSSTRCCAVTQGIMLDMERNTDTKGFEARAPSRAEDAEPAREEEEEEVEEEEEEEEVEVEVEVEVEEVEVVTPAPPPPVLGLGGTEGAVTARPCPEPGAAAVWGGVSGCDGSRVRVPGQVHNTVTGGSEGVSRPAVCAAALDSQQAGQVRDKLPCRQDAVGEGTRNGRASLARPLPDPTSVGGSSGTGDAMAPTPPPPFPPPPPPPPPALDRRRAAVREPRLPAGPSVLAPAPPWAVVAGTEVEVEVEVEAGLSDPRWEVPRPSSFCCRASKAKPRSEAVRREVVTLDSAHTAARSAMGSYRTLK